MARTKVVPDNPEVSLLGQDGEAGRTRAILLAHALLLRGVAFRYAYVKGIGHYVTVRQSEYTLELDKLAVQIGEL
jgi:hypothetical protein